MVASLSTSLTHQVALHAVYATFVLMAVDAVFPAASELVMLSAGAVAAGVSTTSIDLFGSRIGSGISAYVLLATAGTFGYLVGAIVGWWIGKAGGRPLLERHGSWFHLSSRRFDRAEHWFTRWGRWAILVGRIVPLARSFISIPAGVFAAPFSPYVLLTLIGSALWAFAFAGAGYALGSSYLRVDHAFHYVEFALVFGAFVALGGTLVGRRNSSAAGK